MSNIYTLTSVFDLREFDEFTGERLPLAPGEGNECERCHRLHAVVYEVERASDKKRFYVGSTCCRKLFGWEPEREEAKRLEKAARQAAKSRAQERLRAIARPLIEEVLSLPVPRIIETGRRKERYYTQVFWSMEGCPDISVWGIAEEGLDDERRTCLVNAWRIKELKRRVDALYPPTSDNYLEDTNVTRRIKILHVINDLL